ncbi:hypothetical protein [Luteibaculum oceani]|uniref:Protein BatD n=1 Tax=Luteibaculum oceani TaxID=1294296 RepID=A0A5C6UYY2_9FLAO|nr:hypothetical protein [Luteibaculum oceani]TXC76178.1 hypothetical protein FRX97_10525 [Luteibaculum oceani]
MLKKICAVITLITVGFALHAQELQLNLDKQQIRFGEQINGQLIVKVNAKDKKGEILFNKSFEESLGGLELLDKLVIDTVVNESENDFQFNYRYQFSISGFDSGHFFVGPFSLGLGDKNLVSDSIGVSVYPVKIDSSVTEKPIKAIQELPLGFRDYLAAYWYFPVSLAILVILAYLIYRWWKKRKQNTDTIPVKESPKPVIPPHVEALEKLRKLQNEEIWKIKGDKVFYTEISLIIRGYLGKRYNIHALEKTSGEISQLLQYKLQPKSLHEDLSYILNLSDMAKYAKEKPGEAFAKEAVEKAIELVKRTTPIEEEING